LYGSVEKEHEGRRESYILFSCPISITNIFRQNLGVFGLSQNGKTYIQSVISHCIVRNYFSVYFLNIIKNIVCITGIYIYVVFFFVRRFSKETDEVKLEVGIA
jgi:hypothetical protein